MIENIINFLGIDASLVSSDAQFFIGSVILVCSFVFVGKGIFRFFTGFFNRS